MDILRPIVKSLAYGFYLGRDALAPGVRKAFLWGDTWYLMAALVVDGTSLLARENTRMTPADLRIMRQIGGWGPHRRV